MRGTKPERPYTKRELDAFIEEIKRKRDAFCTEHNLTYDDVWVLINGNIHSALLKHPSRTTKGPDRITKQVLLGMHAVHDGVKNIWIIPKQRLPREDDEWGNGRNRNPRRYGS